MESKSILRTQMFTCVACHRKEYYDHGDNTYELILATANHDGEVRMLSDHPVLPETKFTVTIEETRGGELYEAGD